MYKKLCKIATIGIAALGLAGTASADVYTVNMCGASAQAGFWATAGAAVVEDTFSCDDAALDGIDDKNLIVRGQNCDAGRGTEPDTIYVRYNVSNSSGGCSAISQGDALTYAKASTCSFAGGFTCSESDVDTEPCDMGCADVPCSTLTATSLGWAEAECTPPPQPFGQSTGYQSGADTFFLGVTVPFGFIVNNNVTDYVCTAPDIDDLGDNQHLAYNKEGWECDPRMNEVPDEPGRNHQCRGDWKCIDSDQDGTGVCLDGNQDADLDVTISGNEKSCEDASDCKAPYADTWCAPRTLKNVSRLMALHIFSDAVDNWQDFGPGFPDLAIVKCMRHGGSGTHQTLIDTVFRGDAIVKNSTRCDFWDSPADQGAAGKSYVLHYKSSSDLTRQCVAEYAGGIGYVDADKAMFRSKIGLVGAPDAWAGTYGVSQLMYQGVAPSRLAVSQGKYNFWAQQQCFSDSADVDPVTLAIATEVMNGAADPDKLIFDGFGQKALFWATEGEMRVEKGTHYDYPSRVSPDPGFPGVDPSTTWPLP